MPAKSRSGLFRAAFAALFCVAVATSAQPSSDFNIYYGLLHAHTLFSDGSGTPAEAFEMSKGEGLHFFAVTPHNHAAAEDGAKERADGVVIAKDSRLYDSNSILSVALRNASTINVASVMRAAREATGSNFAALYGQEFSTISSGNHVNVIGYDKLLTDQNGNFRSLFDTLDAYVSQGNAMPVVQMNHADVQADLFYSGQSPKVLRAMFNDYGFDDYGGDFRELVEAAGKYVVLIELLSGPAMAKQPNPSFRYKHHHENDYFFYLSQGFHVSPSAGQDNHYKTWGKTSSARMGVLASSLSTEALFEAMRANRTFVTEDKNMSVWLSVNGEPMGSCLDLADGTDLALSVSLSDADEPNSEYEITLIRGDIVPQQRDSLKKLLPSDGELSTEQLQGNGTVRFDASSSGRPEFFYVRVRQDGDDRAWSGPIWINHPRSGASGALVDTWTWTASSGSKIYHHSWCKSVDTILPKNRRTGGNPPASRTLHECVKPADGPSH